MKKQWKTIPPKLRKKILEESKESGSTTAELASRYGIRKERIYRWRAQHSKRIKSPVKAVNTKNNFVEAKVDTSKEERVPINKNVVLKKASLEFAEFTLSIEGSFNVGRMKQIMEAAC